MDRQPRFRWAIAAAVLAAVCYAPASAALAAKAPSHNVEIRRTTGGIPHIKATDWRSLGYGAGYAFAQDNLCALADAFVTVNGERSRWFAPGDNQLGFPAGDKAQNLKSDFFYQRLKEAKVVERLVAKKPPNGPAPDVVLAVEGYAAGYNRYLRDTGVDKLPDPRCRGKAWVRQITPMDLFRRYYQLAIYASSGQGIVLDGLIGATPPAAGRSAKRAVSARTGAVGSALHSQPRPGDRLDLDALTEALGAKPDPTLGSNGIGLGAESTQSGGGMVLGNPHFPWRGTERFYEQHLTIPGKLDVTGASLLGAPVVLIGHNQHVAWTHTVSTARRFVIHQLKLAPGKPTTYVVDGKPVKMRARTVRVKVRGGGVKKHTFYETRYGLAVTLGAANYAWTKQTAYALGDVNASNMRFLNTWYDMDQAKDVRGLVAAQSRTQGNPWVTTEAADDQGNAAYTEDSAIPNVSAAKQKACSPGPLANLVFTAAQVVTLDGSKSSCDLGRDKGAVAPGILAPKHVPIVFRRDYVANSNDSYWLVNPAAPITGYAPIIGPVKTTQGLRTRVGIDQIAKRLAGSDGLGPAKFSLPTLEAMWEGDRSQLAELVADDLAAACAAAPSAKASDGATVDLSAACPILAAYDKTGRADSQGGWLFNIWAKKLQSTPWKVKFDVTTPLTTPNTLDTTSPKVLTALADAVQDLTARGIALGATYADVQHSTRGDRQLPIAGCDTGCYNNIDSSLGDPADGPYGEVYYGSSFVMMADMLPSGPKAQSILTYSQSTNPMSAHFGDQTALFSQGEWLPMLFSDAEIAADPNLATTKLTGR